MTTGWTSALLQGCQRLPSKVIHSSFVTKCLMSSLPVCKSWFKCLHRLQQNEICDSNRILLLTQRPTLNTFHVCGLYATLVLSVRSVKELTRKGQWIN